jgi:hypothetical protein
MRFNSDLVSSYLQPDINKFPSAYNRRHGFQKIITLQGCPNLAHDKLSRSTKDIPSPPRKTRLDSESRFTRHFDNGKTRPAKPPAVPTNPDRSCTYLVLRAHRIVQTSGRPAQSCPWWPPAADKLDQHSEEHWPGGLNKDDPWVGLPKGKEG